MKKQLIECVPNISEGRDTSKINAIASIIETVSGVKLLNIDSGEAANRTVITFAGEPQKVVEAAFKLIQKASELIDMRTQTGEHPCFGATDVCPLVPISGITLEETAVYAYELGKRVGNELGIPVYLYENAAQDKNRKNLANCRSGEYERLKEKLKNTDWKPDFGPSEFNKTVAKTGAIAISARPILIAYNINLNTTSVKKAKSIACDIRESGCIKRDKNGEKIIGTNGKIARIPGKLKAVKGIGWYIEDFKKAQVSCNLTNSDITPIHRVFEETIKSAKKYGVEVTGSELIGLIPLKSMLDTADYYLSKENLSMDISETKKIDIAVKYLGLDELKPFDPNKNIIEYALNINATMVKNVTIIPFEQKYSQDFHDLNIEWLEKYFYVEPHDKEVLENAKSYIIDNNGYIFFAKYNNEIVGTVALINNEEGYELSKMAVLPKYQGLKIGQKLMDTCIQFAKGNNWNEIFIYSHKKLVPAINMYRKNGFIEIPVQEDCQYERSDIKMILEL